MKIYVLGAGAIGSLFGGLLFAAGEDVVLIGRKPHVDAINKRGLRITGIIEEVIKVPATISPPEEKPDLIILATKSYSTVEALRASKAIVEDTWILSIQNGIGNEDEIRKFGGKPIGGITTNGAILVSSGVVKWTGKGITVVGLYPKGRHTFVDKISEIFNRAGLETIVSENIEGWIWAKAIVNSAINPIGTLLRVKNGAILDNEELLSVAVEVVKEGCKVATQNGVKLEVHPIDLLFQTLKKN